MHQGKTKLFTRTCLTLFVCMVLIVLLPTPQAFAAWFQTSGRTHSQSSDGASWSIKSILPNAASIFNISSSQPSRPITSAYGTINVGPGLLASPSPVPRMQQYSVDSSITYDSLVGRVQTLPARVDGTRPPFTMNPPLNGLYITDGNLVISNRWHLNNTGNARYAVIIVPGQLVIKENITVEPGALLTFIVKGDINIAKEVEQVQGIYYTDGRICTKCLAGGGIDN